jgi:hypothetical protein
VFAKQVDPVWITELANQEICVSDHDPAHFAEAVSASVPAKVSARSRKSQGD